MKSEKKLYKLKSKYLAETQYRANRLRAYGFSVFTSNRIYSLYRKITLINHALLWN